MTSLTHSVEDGSCYELSEGVEGHKFEDTERRHQSRPTLPGNKRDNLLINDSVSCRRDHLAACSPQRSVCSYFCL